MTPVDLDKLVGQVGGGRVGSGCGPLKGQADKLEEVGTRQMTVRIPGC